ncbi:MAG: AAA family ATPase, partial [Arenicellales bacterium]|nr:AAA family ATPase [Arenicellales bacterium]
MTDSIPIKSSGQPARVDTVDVPIGETVARVLGLINEVILGKPLQAKLALSCLVAGGHLLIEDVPGVGKTTLGQVLAHVLGLKLSRIQ